MLTSECPDRIQVSFDDHRLVANAGLLPVTLAGRLGLRELVDSHLDLGDAPGQANVGDKALTLVTSALAGVDFLEDADALRSRGTGSYSSSSCPSSCPTATVHCSSSAPTSRSCPMPRRRPAVATCCVLLV